jgi:hypothetical protein
LITVSLRAGETRQADRSNVKTVPGFIGGLGIK